MSKFIYESQEITVEAYGQTYTLPPKTPELMEKLSAVSAVLLIPSLPTAQATAVLDGITAILGESEAHRIFPVFEKIDTDELSALWLHLSREYEKQASAVLAQYSYERAER